MSTRFSTVVCLECHYESQADVMIAACPNCGSAWVDARYDLTSVKEKWLTELPRRETSLWRYSELLPIGEADPEIWLGEGWTPLVRLYQYERLYNHQQIYFKDERQSPTNSFKDRQAALSVTAMKRAGIREVVLASTGNAGVAYAAYCARAGIKLWLFVNSLVPVEKMREAALYGAEVIKISGTYDEAKTVAGEFAKQRGIHYDKGAKSIPGKESMKTIAFELAEQLGLKLGMNGRWQSPDWYIQAVSGGIGPLGVWKGFSELLSMGLIDKMPKLAICQSAGCSPMVDAYLDDRPVATAVIPNTLITVLATGDPGYSYVQLLQAVNSNGGVMISIEDGEAFEAMRHVAARAGLSVEPATSVAFASLEKMLQDGTIEPGEIVVVNATGHTMPAESHILGNEYVVNLEKRGNLTKAESDNSIEYALESLNERVTTILVVDDNNNDRRLMKKMLQRYKAYRLLEAKTGKQALEMIADRKPDLIVTDLRMPEMDGLTFLKQLKQNNYTYDIPVIVVSAKALSPEDEAVILKYSDSIWLKGDFSRRRFAQHIVNTLGHDPIEETKPHNPLWGSGLDTQQIVWRPSSGRAFTNTILILDSDSDDRRLARKILETEGTYEVLEAETGRLGLKTIHESKPDLVIMDLMLPDLDGYAVLEKLANDKTINHIPVVIFTGKELTPMDMAKLPIHFDSILHKNSMDRGHFLSIIRKKLN